MQRIKNSGFLIAIFLVCAALQSCRQQSPLIQSEARLQDIQRMLTVQKKLTANSQVSPWSVFDRKLTPNERQAMEFLYAYMPLSDLADYRSDFILANVKQTLRARKEMAWGKLIPEEVFLHFVLPMRVNNENLDSFRLVMYDEIRNRVKGLGMAEAALEINHWCHEKVNYRPTDIRTSAPLSTIRKSFGRCGEESTFTVSALRTAGIPARQVYTPRWAHTDDNHAWVEVWVDGKWQYMGACEPEPTLNLGWFTEPSKRAMLVHTRAYGRYYGKEDVITPADRFSELNVTASYAPVKTFTVVVKTRAGKAADSIRVDFGLYNYAEFYPIASRYTDKKGETKITSGLGDLLVWASDGSYSGYRMISVSKTDSVLLTLNLTNPSPHTEIYDIIPPHAIQSDSTISKEDKQKNNRRMAHEDSIRNAYMATFKNNSWAGDMAAKYQLSSDTVSLLIAKAYGNWPELEAYFAKNAHDYRSTVLLLAGQLSDKDLSDARETILTDHLKHTLKPAGLQQEIFAPYLLSPRIANEALSPWRSFLQAHPGNLVKPGDKNADEIIKWIGKNITVNEEANRHSRAPLTPIGVYNLRVADRQSRDIFFVALCRASGIPARLNPVTLIPEYYASAKWIPVSLDGRNDLPGAKGYVQFTSRQIPVTPQYYKHFTLAKLTGGFYTTLEFDEGKELTDFPSSLPLDTGHYRLVTGNRLADGSVLASVVYFNLGKDQKIKVPVDLRALPENTSPSGKLDLKGIKLQGLKGGQSQDLASLKTKAGLVLVLLDPEKEPSKHVLQDIAAYAAHFNQWKGRFVFAVVDDKSSQAGVLDNYRLPLAQVRGIDRENNILKALENMHGSPLSEKLPVVVMCDQMGAVYLFSSGYQIGIGEQLLRLTR